MERRNVPHEQPRRNDGRPQGGVPYNQLAENIAAQLAGLQVPGEDNDRNIEDAQIENENESLPGTHEPPQGSNERQRNVPYRQLAENMAQPLANLQVAGADNETARNDDVQIGNESENHQGVGKTSQGRDRRQKQRPYNQLAADMAQPLADLKVPGDNNEIRKRGDGRTDEDESRAGTLEIPQENSERHRGTQLATEMVQPLADPDPQVPGVSNEEITSKDDQAKSVVENRPDVASVDQRDGAPRRRGRNHYFDLAADMAGPLAEVRAPGISEDRSSPQMQTEHQAVEFIPHQESLSEYDPDATCGSTCESYGQWSSQSETRPSERSTQASQDEGNLSIAQQESLSEYNEDARCGSGFFRSESDFTDYSGIQTTDFESNDPGSFGTGGFRSKSPTEIDTSKEECFSQVDDEPYTKRAKPDPEVSKELLPGEGTSSIESTTSSRQEAIHDVCSSESNPNEDFPLHSEGINTQDSLGLSRPRTGSPFESRLSSDFQHMNFAGNRSAESSASYDYSGEQSSPVAQSHQEKSPNKNEDYSFPEKATDSSVERNDAVSTASALPQGARPKTSANIPRGKKHKTPKKNTKNSYTELAKHVSGDLTAANRQLDASQASTRKASEERKSVRAQELFDGSNLKSVTSDASSEHAPPLAPPLPPLGVVQGGTPQQPCLTHDEGHRGRGVREDFSRESADSRASAQQMSRAEARAQHRTQVEEQQRLIDNMAPELQAMVVEMIRQDEEEQGGHVLMQWNPPAPPRSIPQGNNTNQGACAEGASKQPGGKKSQKGQKKKGHYLELAGAIAPQLAAVNAVMVNGHAEEKEGVTGTTNESHTGFAHPVAMGETDAVHSRDQYLSNHGARASSRDHPHAHMSLPHSATSRRDIADGRGAYSLGENARTSSQRRGGANRNNGASADSTGKENRGKKGKKKKAKEESKSGVLQMAESMAESFQSLNARLEEQQRQQRSRNGNGAVARPSPPHDESATRDTRSDVTNKSNSSRTENGQK